MRLKAVKARIRQACVQAGRSPDEVTLLAVSKTQPAQAVRDAVAAGLHEWPVAGSLAPGVYVIRLHAAGHEARTTAIVY